MLVAGFYGSFYVPAVQTEFSHHVVEMMNTMAWGIGLGALFIFLLSYVPQKAFEKYVKPDDSLKGILKAVAAGVVFDLCSHGILFVAMNLYKRGLTLPQVMAFLVASPWNSLSLTLVLASLVGWGWTGVFIVLSAVIAIVTGIMFRIFLQKGILKEVKAAAQDEDASESSQPDTFWQRLTDCFSEMRMILKWLFIGVILASLMRFAIPTDMYEYAFGATLLGLLITLLVATVLEVCSEGSAPIAADILTRASAPGNSFAFLMAGVATDYTEIMVLKDTTKSWKIALFLPLITLPQTLVFAVLLNMFAT